MKRVTSFVCAVLLLVMAAVPVIAQEDMSLYGIGFVRTDNGGYLNLRRQPSMNARVLETMPYGSQVDIDYSYDDSQWYRVVYNGTEGYAMVRYISNYQPNPIRPTARPTQPPDTSNLAQIFNGFYKTSYYASVRPSTPGGFVNFRWAPSQQMPVMSRYYSGYRLEVISQNNTWAQVYDVDSNTVGFMMRNFLSEITYIDGKFGLGEQTN